jgi:hypothetical protein
MLRDDAIRAGLIEPNAEDIVRLRLDPKHLPVKQIPPPREETLDERLEKRKEELNKVPYQAMLKAAKALGIELQASMQKEEVVELLATSLSPARYKEFFDKIK